jgi:predicted nucleic acid-binding protein
VPVVFDASMLIDLLNPKLSGDRKARIDYLIATLQKQRTKILIPTPAFTELMINADKARDAYYQRLNTSSSFQIVPFDAKAAMECAFLLKEAWEVRARRNVTRTKFKFDWQIIAIAASRGASTIYSDDEDIGQYGKRAGIVVLKIDQLELPESARQHKLELDSK